MVWYGEWRCFLASALHCFAQLSPYGFNSTSCSNKHEMNWKLKENIPALHLIRERERKMPQNSFLDLCHLFNELTWKHRSCFVQTKTLRPLGLQASAAHRPNAQVVSRWPPLRHGSRLLFSLISQHEMGVTMPCTATTAFDSPHQPLWHCQWLSTCQLIVIPARVRMHRVAHGWNR